MNGWHSPDDYQEKGTSVGTQTAEQLLSDTASLMQGDVPSDESAQDSTSGKRCSLLSCCWKGGESNDSPDGNAYDLIPTGEMPAVMIFLMNLPLYGLCTGSVRAL